MPKTNLILGDTLEEMAKLPSESVDVIFADPPYFLPARQTCKGGKRVSNAKGKWDTHPDPEGFTENWLEAAFRLLKPTGTIWVCGNHESLWYPGYIIKELGRILNVVVWEKPNPPPNLGCRTMTHSHEMIIWASKNKKGYVYNYDKAKAIFGKQLKDVWTMPAPGVLEKRHGRHATQKPLALVERALTISCPAGGIVLDPFMGSGTTCVAAAKLGFESIGIDSNLEYYELASKRIADVEGPITLTLDEVMAGAEQAAARVEQWPEWKKNL